MAQHDYSIANQTFPNTRQDLNNSLSAIVSNNSGATEPTTTYAYQWWYDETTDTLKMRNSDNDAWITMFTFDQTADTYSLATDVELTITENLDLTGSATISGDLTVDTNTLYVDSTNNRVGVGTNSPSSTLEVIGSINLSDGGTQGILVRSDGSIEISKTDGTAFIDFKTSTSEDRDARIQQLSNGLSFETGGNGSVSPSMVITSAGNVGVGDTTPLDKMHIYEALNSATATQLLLQNEGAGSNSAGIAFQVSSSAETTGFAPKAGIVFERNLSNGRGSLKFFNDEVNDTNGFSAGDEVMRIHNNGKLGILTSSPVYDLDVNGSLNCQGTLYTGGSSFELGGTRTVAGSSFIDLHAEVGTDREARIIRNPTANGSLQITNNGTGSIDVIASSNGVRLTSGATSWASISDEREKDIIEPITNATDKISNMRTVIGKYKNDEENIRRSFLIAQDVKEVFPEAVEVIEDEQQTLALRYTEIIPLLVKSIQELKADNDALKTRIETLENA